ncbi:tRNA (N6-isopentenyl adenosine(37)-C2)-methylthiotransferase MiaB [Vineibacter terrae]|uniref:tRNA (N6-isopentenyl adenosine(37)-C2)-methylthiotransferase MiaB n=1 Tax=Vineibacter terrae TaxID=2586908 RepID=UPI002E2F50E6|nr:tRNA (N6-isopentenyl adenosine(37)-C2)-methylthiotransferase MiaB [Vineibacter terrae]HEX2889653.1 tRNA (N6-isopentenyl adenosine(37)-C2)-methylthiotransferase MiaB [Vineibacter terrae]
MTEAPTARKKGLFIRTYGCQMNVYDSERMADVLRPLGYAPASTPDDADMVIVNTCHIREKASEKVFSELGRLRDLKAQKRQAGDDLVIAVAGCVAQAEGAEIMRRQPAVDIVVGPQAYHRLPEMVARAARAAASRRPGTMKGAGVLDTEFPVEPKFDHLPAPTTVSGGSAFVSVQEGCDKFCTFCVVPYTRGAEYSRPAAAVIAEARGLVAAGAREITLLGQNVNAWHGAAPDGSTWTLARLIAALAEIEGLARIRYTTSHPRDMDAALIAAHRDVPALMPYLHLPVQSGADRVLEAMNRGHGRDHYLRLVDQLRAARPDMALSTDIIVGFPGETDGDFDDTMRLVREVGFAAAFSFKYSARPGTPAAMMARQVPEAVRDARLQALQALLGEQQRRFNGALTGHTVPVLFQEAGRKPGQLLGKSPWLQSVHADGDARLLGQIVDVRIVAAHAVSLSGEIVAGDFASTRTAAAKPIEVAA